MCLVSRFGFDLTFRTTGHDPWFDSIAKCQAHVLRERGYAPAFVRFPHARGVVNDTLIKHEG
ncbi:MAG: hypothetical protein IIT54_06225 [Acetobacter sp.]|nr:hypothetical protein [Acetobacter sp.]